MHPGTGTATRPFSGTVAHAVWYKSTLFADVTS